MSVSKVKVVAILAAHGFTPAHGVKAGFHVQQDEDGCSVYYVRHVGPEPKSSTRVSALMSMREAFVGRFAVNTAGNHHSDGQIVRLVLREQVSAPERTVTTVQSGIEASSS